MDGTNCCLIPRIYTQFVLPFRVWERGPYMDRAKIHSRGLRPSICPEIKEGCCRPLNLFRDRMTKNPSHLLYPWIIEHGELDWKHTFTGLNAGFAQVCRYQSLLRSESCLFGHTPVQDRSNYTKGKHQNGFFVAPEVQQ